MYYTDNLKNFVLELPLFFVRRVPRSQRGRGESFAKSSNVVNFRKAQGIGSRLASLGGQFVLNFGLKNQLAILLLGKENFLIKTI